MKDFYKIMNVPHTASADEIRRAYHRQVKKYHPDRNPGNAVAHKRFLEIQEAYEILSNEKKRQQFHLTTRYAWLTKNKQEETAEVILQKCKKLNLKIKDTGTSRLNVKAVHLTIDGIISQINNALATEEMDEGKMEQIAAQLLPALAVLPYDTIKCYIGTLLQLAGSNVELHQQIQLFEQKKKGTRIWDSYNHWIIVVATVVICLMILLLSR